MNNIFWATHLTLTKEHAECSIKYLLEQQTEMTTWDNFVIHNTHPDEISNEYLLELINKYDVHKQVKSIQIDPRRDSKNHSMDLIQHMQYVVDRGWHTTPGKTLLLKQEYVVSKTFNRSFNSHPDSRVYWALPIYQAKEKVDWRSNEFDIQQSYNSFIPITPNTMFLRNDANVNEWFGWLPNASLRGIPVPSSINGAFADTHPAILFVAVYSQSDLHVQVFSNDICETVLGLMQMFLHTDKSWGDAYKFITGDHPPQGVPKLLDLARRGDFVWSTDIGAYATHLYHDVISANRSRPREFWENGPAIDQRYVPGERY